MHHIHTVVGFPDKGAFLTAGYGECRRHGHEQAVAPVYVDDDTRIGVARPGTDVDSVERGCIGVHAAQQHDLTFFLGLQRQERETETQ